MNNAAVKIDPERIAPQPGPQTAFFTSAADIVIYGGGAFGGKTWALLMEALRHIKETPGFGVVIFRRTTKQVTQEGGLWDQTKQLYFSMGAKPRSKPWLDWTFPPHGNRVTFSHLEHEDTVYDFDGSQIPMIGFDQLEHFTEKQFFYMLSRNRSLCGVKPYIRATCNPNPFSWLREFLDWWIDDATGYAIESRSGVTRWFVRFGDDIHWFDSRAEAKENFPGPDYAPLSVCFIRSTPHDNKIGMSADPTYMAKLRAMPLVEQERLIAGNWKIKPAAGMYFKGSWFEVVDTMPAEIIAGVRGWDLAATEAGPGTDPDFTAGVRMWKHKSGILFIDDVIHERASPGRVKSIVTNTASMDGRGVRVRMRQDPGQAGKAQVADYALALAGFSFSFTRETGDKVTRAGPFSSQCEAGNVKLVRGASGGKWIDGFVTELENFPEGHDDRVDGSVTAYDEFAGMPLILA